MKSDCPACPRCGSDTAPVECEAPDIRCLECTWTGNPCSNYDELMQEEYDYAEYCEDRELAEKPPVSLEEWRERRKKGWWGLQ